MTTQTRIGEVIEASTAEFQAQCDELHNPPPLGSVVVVREGDVETFALVSHVETTSIDPGRRAVSQGAGLASEEELYKRHPELNALLRTLFFAIVVAHRQDDRFYPYVPPRPPRIHAFVHTASPEETKGLAESPGVLPALVGANAEAGDDFIAAGIRALATSSPDPEAFLADAGRRLVHLMRGESQRLQTLLPKIRPS